MNATSARFVIERAAEVSSVSKQKRLVVLGLVSASVCLVGRAEAKNAIELENERPVDAARDSWLPALDPTTYAALKIGIDGVIDGYPSRWSVKNGDVLGLRVSTTAKAFRTRIYRIGWYPSSPTGAVGSRLVWEAPATTGVRQPFPAEDGDRGLAEAKWSDSVSLTIPCDWVTGAYVARFTTDSGMEAFTYFFVRDDAATTKAKILMVDTTTTAQAYNPWPKLLDASGKQTQGKSTYAYNSAGVATKASGEARAVAVSYDRPHGENWGLGIFRDWTIPMVQWLEQNKYDVAYAEDRDLHVGAVLAGRAMWMDSGHDEYWSAGMWDQLAAARDAGMSVAFFSGNDLTWQVRFEAGSGGPMSTMVTYKGAAFPRPTICGTCSDWGGDPEFQLALAAKTAGKTTEQVAHLKNVTYAWSSLSDFDPTTQKFVAAPSTVARYAIGLEGLQGGPKLPECVATSKPDDPCNGVDFVVQNASHWIYTGASVKGGVASLLVNGDVIPHIVGYEMDSAYVGATYPVARPAGQQILATTDTRGYVGYFNAQYYDHPSGAHVFSAGTINWAWGLPRGDLGQWGNFALDTTVGKTRLDTAVGAITTNVLNKMSDGPIAIAPKPPSSCITPPPPPVDAGVDAGVEAGVDAGFEAGVDAIASDGSADATEPEVSFDASPPPPPPSDATDDGARADALGDGGSIDDATSERDAGSIGDGAALNEAGNADDGTSQGGGCSVVDRRDARERWLSPSLLLGAIAALALARRRRARSSIKPAA